MFDLKQITLDSPVVTKLIKTIERGWAAAFEPRQIIRMARAEAEAKSILTESDLQRAQALRAFNDETRDRAMRRAEAEEVRRQRNLESIFVDAIKALPEEVDEIPVDDDWFFDFMSNCRDVGNKQMQAVWSGILAGEVASPGSFARRTLAAVRLLAADEAGLFQSFCCLVHRMDTEYVHLERAASIRERAGISFKKLVHLRVIGLVEEEAGGVSRILQYKEGDTVRVEYAGRRWMATMGGSHQFDFPIVSLSRVGIELFPIMDVQRNTDYETALVKEVDKRSSEFGPVVSSEPMTDPDVSPPQE